MNFESGTEPLWGNFAALFRAVDAGNTALNIWPYNGGLFAHDPVADALVLPDNLAGEVAGLGNWDYRREVPVTVLGHIFEQSITDLEKLRAESRGEAPPTVSKRKREGVVYTPAMVTRFLVEKTILRTLGERFDAAWAAHGMGDDAVPAAQIAFWRDYLETLRGLTIVDPACGSGAFLVAAFDALTGEYGRSEKALEALGEALDFDIFDEIVSKNLYGVDVNSESVEITRLSLWLKTARRDHRLQNLEATIRVGDSLIEVAAFTARPFDWRAAFPQVFAQGGFDVVIGNPPYVRMELIKAVKPYLERHYVVAADRADLYAYFFERGVGLLKPMGRLGFITSSTFFRTGSGEALRTFLTDKLSIESVVDFGDTQVFEGVTTYPAILTLRKGNGAPAEVAFLAVRDEAPEELGQVFGDDARNMPLSRLGAGTWRFEDEELAHLRDKIAKGRRTLGEAYGEPLYGIKTGLNEAFVIDAPTHDRLLKADKRSAEILKPFLRGEDVKRWRVEPEGLWLINTPRSKVDIDKYPAVRDWLAPFKPELEKRATKQEWFELQQAQLAYQPKFDAPKIVYQDITAQNPFTFDAGNHFLANTCYFLDRGEAELLSYLNSRSAWFFLTSVTNIARGGYFRLRSDFVSQLPIPEMPAPTRARLAALGQACTDSARQRFAIQSSVRHRILDLSSPEHSQLNGKLHDWHDLDFAAFRAEVKRALRAEIPLKERGEWEAWLA